MALFAFGPPPFVCPDCRVPYYRSGIACCPACGARLPVRPRACAICGTTDMPPRVKFCSDPCREAGKLLRPSAPVRAARSDGPGPYARRAAREAAAPGYATEAQLAARRAYYRGRCWMCGAPAVCMDHVKPLARGGSNWPSNQRPACWSCNYRKAAHWPLPAWIGKSCS